MFHVFSMLTLPWDTAASSSFAAAHQDDGLGDYRHYPGLLLQLQAHRGAKTSNLALHMFQQLG